MSRYRRIQYFYLLFCLLLLAGGVAAGLRPGWNLLLFPLNSWEMFSEARQESRLYDIEIKASDLPGFQSFQKINKRPRIIHEALAATIVNRLGKALRAGDAELTLRWRRIAELYLLPAWPNVPYRVVERRYKFDADGNVKSEQGELTVLAEFRTEAAR